MTSTLYRELAELPVYTSATFLNGDDAAALIRVTSSVRDHSRKIKRSLQRTVIYTPSDVLTTNSESSVDVLKSATSPSGKLVAYLREIESNGGKKRFVEVWRGSKLEAIKEVTKAHAEFYTDDFFSCLSFAPSESALVYTAEGNAPGEDDQDRFRYVPTLGERLQKRQRPTLFLLQWTSNSNAHLAALQPSLTPPSTILFGQAVFSANETIIARGYETSPDGRRLGITGCTNRTCAIWKLNLPRHASDALRKTFDHSGQAYEPSTEPKSDNSTTISVDCTRLSSPTTSARSPRVFDGQIVWLSSGLGGPHNGCSALHKLDLVTGSHKEILPIIHSPATPDAFPGLFADYISERAVVRSKDGAALAIQTVWGSRKTVVLVSLIDGSVTEITPKDGADDIASWSLLATDGERRVLCSRSSPTTVPELVLGTIDDARNAVWRVLEQEALSDSAAKTLNSMKSSIVRVPDRHPLEMIVVQGSTTSKPPCVMVPHGGPHISNTTDFNPAMAAMVAEGYTVSMVNYTGSLGHGQAYIEKLLGRAGELDVEECFASAQHLVQIGIADAGPGKQFIIGGSHAGFLGAHLVARYPDYFSACSLRNPVVAVGDMAHVTDIPDWCFSQFSSPSVVPTGHLASPEEHARLQAASPLSYVAAVKAPVLLLVGDADARVPMTQAKAYYHALKGHGRAKVEMYLFPGAGHSLDQVEAELQSWEHTKEWFANVVKF
ncbi:alpha/beta-hydrolase [Exidia glandulosa HHB12029]|uniref:acylaminoacyl-peptidase n=1 Tax=Exidia glandulosa HHB12029 TaxID=1314781 RepID=A0A165GDH4_EXIGL|nr:alpha/beta-hydrolase [Exidia glandulosa HHB12029]